MMGGIEGELKYEKEKALKELLRKLTNGEYTHIGDGRSGDVKMLTIDADSDLSKTWVLKIEREKTKEQEALNLTMRDELLLHSRAMDILVRARIANPDKLYADIPEIIGFMNEWEKPVLFIEYVEGNTLFERALKEFIITYTVDDPDSDEGREEINEIQEMTKEELIDRASEPDLVNVLPPRYRHEIQLEGGQLDENAFIGIALDVNRLTKGQSKIINEKQFEALTNTVKLLHAKGFHHRDLHASNIMIKPDGTVSIIDFGLSVDTRALETGSVYTENIGNAMQERYVKLMKDLEMLETYYKVARKRV